MKKRLRYRMCHQFFFVEEERDIYFDFSCAALTAYNALYGPVPVKAGDYVLVLGTGGVSMYAGHCHCKRHAHRYHRVLQLRSSIRHRIRRYRYCNFVI